MIPEKKLKNLEKKIKDECLQCHGQGCITCKSLFSRVRTYAVANIPRDYWLLPFKDFEGDPNFKEALVSKIKNIGKMYDNGESLAFVGNLGTGKTYAACCILKMAISKGYTAKYFHMAELINDVVSANVDKAEYMKHLMNVDFLVLDEFDKRWIFPSEKAEQLFGQTLEYVLRCRFQNYMPTILCSNTRNLNDVLSDDFSRAFESLSSQYLKIMYVGGKDFRKRGNQ